VRLTIVYTETDYYQGIYWILKEPTPTAGVFREAITRVDAVDWLGLAYNMSLPTLAIYTDKRVDELLTTLVAAVAVQPPDTGYDTGDSTMATGFDKDDTKTESVYAVLAKLCRSEFGRIYITRSTVTPYLEFESRNSGPLIPAAWIRSKISWTSWS